MKTNIVLVIWPWSIFMFCDQEKKQHIESTEVQQLCNITSVINKTLNKIVNMDTNDHIVNKIWQHIRRVYQILSFCTVLCICMYVKRMN